ncbi:uncharacterized protein [Amphiura filiformis]|uniref:uncharacterized protein isoform X2 n=1 Tax=Amphiura filiformis TaxID=82378 RepID=UPI003B20B8F9
MDSFLKESKRKLSTLSDETKVHVVIGNESCDLDSAVSALVYAYYLHSVSKQTDGDSNVLYIPILNIPHQDYSVRTEVTHCLQAHHITDDILVFRDEANLRTLHEKSQLLLTLVDHNVLVSSDSFLDDDIVEIVDHHSNGRHDGEDRKLDITLETVGSCCTLVTEKILLDGKEILDETTATLLLSTILVDTFNLSESAKKTTPKDEAMVAELQQLCSINRQVLFEEIERVKFDVSGLSTSDLLKKDYKSLLGSNINIGLSSITLHLRNLIERPSLESDLERFCLDRNLHILLLINLALVDKETPQRQLGIYSPGYLALKDTLVKTLQESDAPQLQLSEIDNAPLSIAAFDQGNTAASRKKLMPLAQQFLEDLEKDPQRVQEFIDSKSDSKSGTMDLSSVDLLSGLDPLETSLGNPSTNQNNANDDDDPFGLGSLSSSEPIESIPVHNSDDPFGLDIFDTTRSSGTNAGQESSTSELLDLDPFGGKITEDCTVPGPPGLLDLDPFADTSVSTGVSSSEASLLPDLAELTNSTPQPPSLLDLGDLADSISSSSNLASATSDPSEPMATSPSSPSSIPLVETQDLLGLDPFDVSQSSTQDIASSADPFSSSINPFDSTNGNLPHSTNIENQNANDLLGLNNFNNPSAVAISTKSNTNVGDLFDFDTQQSAPDNDIFNLGISGEMDDITNESVNSKNSNDLFNLGTSNDLEQLNLSDQGQHVENDLSVSDLSNHLNRNDGQKPGRASLDLLGLAVSSSDDTGSQQVLSPIDQQIYSPKDKDEEIIEDDNIFSNGNSTIPVPHTSHDIPKTPKNSVSDIGDISLAGFQEKVLDKEALSEKVEELQRTKSFREADEEAEVIAINGDSHGIPRDDSFSPLGGLESSETFSDEPSDSSSGESYTVNEENRGLEQFPITQIQEDGEDNMVDENDESQAFEAVPEEVAAEVEEYVNNVMQMSSFLYKQEVFSSEKEDTSDDAILQDGDNDDATRIIVDADAVGDKLQDGDNDDATRIIVDADGADMKVEGAILQDGDNDDATMITVDADGVDMKVNNAILQDGDNDDATMITVDADGVDMKVDEAILQDGDNDDVTLITVDADGVDMKEDDATLQDGDNDDVTMITVDADGVDMKVNDPILQDGDNDDATLITVDADGVDMKVDDEEGKKAEFEDEQIVKNDDDDTAIGEILSSEQHREGTAKAIQELLNSDENVSHEINHTEQDNVDEDKAEIPVTTEGAAVMKTSSVEIDESLAEKIDEYVDTVVQTALFEYKQEVSEVVQSVNEQTEVSDNDKQTNEGVDSYEVIDNKYTLLDTKAEVPREMDDSIASQASQSEVNEVENMQAADVEFKDKGVTMETILTKEEINVCESGDFDGTTNVEENEQETTTDTLGHENTNQQSKESVADTLLLENQTNLNCQTRNTKEQDDICIDTNEVNSYVESVIQMAYFTHQEQVKSGEQYDLEASEKVAEEVKSESSISSNSDRNGQSGTESGISPIQSAMSEAEMSAFDNSSVPEVIVTATETTVSEAVVHVPVPTEEATAEPAIQTSEEIVLPTEGSTTETAISNADEEITTGDANNTVESSSDAEKEASVQEMDASFDENFPSFLETTPSRPGTLPLSDSRGGKTKIKPVYSKPKNQAGTPGSLLSEDGSIYSVTTLDAVNMFPITPSPGSASDEDDDLDQQAKRKQALEPHSPPKRLVSVDSAMAQDIGGDWTGEREILEKVAARQKEKQQNTGQRLTPKLEEQGRQLSVASAAAKQRMEGIQLPDEWQDDDLAQQTLYGHENADNEFYNRSVPRMDSIREDGQKRVESGTSTTESQGTLSASERRQRLGDRDLERGDNSMSGPEEGKQRDGGEVAGELRRRHMSEDSLEDDIAYLEEVGELDISDDEDDAEFNYMYDKMFPHWGEGARPKKKIPAELDLDQMDGPGISVSTNGAAMLSPTTTEEMSWDDDGGTGQKPESIPEYSAKEEMEDKKNWRRVMIGGKEHAVDMRAINPYKKVLSHGGYYGDGLNAIIVFASCYMPDKSRKDYNYVMHNLFLYVVSTLELLVAQDYMIVYFHGAALKSKIPSLGWMRKCYKMIDRKLRKNLKGLYLVHPTTWLKTVVRLTRPFVSSKFSSKLKFIYSLEELEKLIPMDFVYVPDEVRRHDERIKRKENGRHWWGWLGTNTLSDDEFDETCEGSELSSIDDLDDLLFPQLPRERNKHRHGELDFPSPPQSTTSDERGLEAEMESSDSGCSDHEDLHHEGVEGGGFMEDDIFAYSNGNVTPVNRTPRPLFINARRRENTGDRTPTNEMN